MKRFILLFLLAGTCYAQSCKPKPASKPGALSKSAPECQDGWSEGGTFVPMKCENGKWIVDVVTLNYYAKENKHRQELYFAMRSRLLSVKEMQEVSTLGEFLVRPLCPYACSDDPDEYRRAFNDALLQQFKIRVAANRSECCKKEVEP